MPLSRDWDKWDQRSSCPIGTPQSTTLNAVFQIVEFQQRDIISALFLVWFLSIRNDIISLVLYKVVFYLHYQKYAAIQ